MAADIETQQGYLINKLEDLQRGKDEKEIEITVMKRELGMNAAVD